MNTERRSALETERDDCAFSDPLFAGAYARDRFGTSYTESWKV